MDIVIFENFIDFLMEMGFCMDYEFVVKGYLFRKGIMKIMVYKIFRILVLGNIESIEVLLFFYFVELSVVVLVG